MEADCRGGRGGSGHHPLNEDPFDRLLIEQAQTEDLVLISNEALFDDFAVNRLWLGAAKWPGSASRGRTPSLRSYRLRSGTKRPQSTLVSATNMPITTSCTAIPSG